MKRILSTVPTLLILVLLVVSCGGKAEPQAAQAPAPTTTPQAAAPQATQAPAPKAADTAASAPTEAPEPTEAPAPTSAGSTVSDDASSSDARPAAHDSLDSYRSIFTMTYLGTDTDGGPIDERVEISQEYTRDPLARHLLARYEYGSETGEEPSKFEYYQTGNEGFILADEETGWMSVSEDNPPFGMGSLMRMGDPTMLVDLAEMRRALPDEPINGITSRHYQFDEGMLHDSMTEGTGELTARGDLWIAEDGNFVTRYELTIEIKGGDGAALYPDMAEGAIEFTFDLLEVNSDIVIDALAATTAGRAGSGDDSDRAWVGGFAHNEFPLPEGTRFQLQSEDIFIIESDRSFEELAAFYEQSLPGSGWTKNVSDSILTGNMGVQIYEKNGQRLLLTLTQDPSTGKSMLMVSAE